ncbi:M28 family peptidase [Neorhodopirellula pilleata]|uniref:Peptidase family M28 n=1 Tax=Neorhodopirellula pilleata TaxID=2714738 RepID=A0A5C6AVP9_9BACT|nr:M28 family peptidase [Neorhodopirellula pilleata]TWU04105.1 Peptidase family M28 [Neorhodopirellula pilleata]
MSVSEPKAGRVRSQGMSPDKFSSVDPHASSFASTANVRPVSPLRRWWPLLVLGMGIGGGLAVYWKTSNRGLERPLELTSRPIPAIYSAERAMGYLERLCEFGPRPTASPAFEQQKQFLVEFFQNNGADVRLQTETIRHPETGEPVEMSNLIASWFPERPIRFLGCAHYDTRPFPDRDRDDPRGVFVGANDGASGTAVWMEMSHHFSALPEDIGVDVVLFDAEEFIFDESRDEFFLGSTFFAQQYRISPPSVPYRAGVLLDMVGDRELQLLYERNSLRYARDVTRSIWRTADRLGVRAFVPRTRMQEIRDDHLPLNQIAGIPTTDLIDFDYPRPGFRAPQYWHTTQDIPENCSGSSLAAVTWVVHQWILEQSEIR